jgi:hypothetical protein
VKEETEMKKFGIKAVAASTVFLALAACSGEPSNSDIKEIVNKEIKPVMEMQWKMMGNVSAALGGGQKSSPPTLDDIKKVGCKADGENAYRCDVELVVLAGDKKDSKVVPLRFVKTSSGWKAGN